MKLSYNWFVQTSRRDTIERVHAGQSCVSPLEKMDGRSSKFSLRASTVDYQAKQTLEAPKVGPEDKHASSEKTCSFDAVA